MQEYIFQRQVGAERHFARQIGQVAVAAQQVAPHGIERTAIVGGSGRCEFPVYRSGIPGIGIRCIACSSELVEADGRIYPVERFYVRMFLHVVDNKQEGRTVARTWFIRAIAVSLSSAFIVLNHL